MRGEIVAKRKAAGLSQSELARLADIERTRLCRFEGGKLDLSKTEITTLLECLQLALERQAARVSAVMRDQLGE
jgi:predicted transcriptional regulator